MSNNIELQLCKTKRNMYSDWLEAANSCKMMKLIPTHSPLHYATTICWEYFVRTIPDWGSMHRGKLNSHRCWFLWRNRCWFGCCCRDCWVSLWWGLWILFGSLILSLILLLFPAFLFIISTIISGRLFFFFLYCGRDGWIFLYAPFGNLLSFFELMQGGSSVDKNLKDF